MSRSPFVDLPVKQYHPLIGVGTIAQIAALPKQPFAELKQLWRELYGVAPSTHNRLFIEKRIAYKLQEREYAKKHPELLIKNRERIDRLIERLGIEEHQSDGSVHGRRAGTKGGKRRRGARVQLMAGTVLTREFRGRTVRVMVNADGRYEYDGVPYTSLTAIAFAVTGVRWSGLDFFGLNRKVSLSPQLRTESNVDRATREAT
jgi:hypothetical protein